jgi:hypothetical protein
MAAEAAQRRLAASRVRRRWALALLAVAIVLALADGDALSSAGTLLSIGALTLIGVVGWRYASAEQRRLQRALEANGPQGARRSSGASGSSA